jgi:short-subunit dehydrogenase
VCKGVIKRGSKSGDLFQRCCSYSSSAAIEISNETGNEVLSVSADITRREDLSGLVEISNEFLGSIDILVLSTGHHLQPFLLLKRPMSTGMMV